MLGGTGFVGSRVVEALVARGCSVTSVSKSGKAPNIVGESARPRRVLTSVKRISSAGWRSVFRFASQSNSRYDKAARC